MYVNTVVRSLITMSAERITSGKLTQEEKLKILQKTFLARLCKLVVNLETGCLFE